MVAEQPFRSTLDVTEMAEHIQRVGEQSSELLVEERNLGSDPILHFAPFLSTPFELYALNPILLFTSFLSKLHFSAVLSIFFVKESESNPILHFGSFLSGRTQNPQTPNTQTSEPLNPRTPP